MFKGPNNTLLTLILQVNPFGLHLKPYPLFQENLFCIMHFEGTTCCQFILLYFFFIMLSPSSLLSLYFLF